MCMTEDGGYMIPYAGEDYPVPTDAPTLGLIHDSFYHLPPKMFTELVALAYIDLNRLWYAYRREMYSEYSEARCTEQEYKTAMSYLVACAMHNDVLQEMVRLHNQLKSQAW